MNTEQAPRRFAVGLSFPGEVRDFARQLYAELRVLFQGQEVFLDEEYLHELAGVDLDLKLRAIYRDQCDLVVPVFCSHYDKPWCRVEWSSIRAGMLEWRQDDRVLPISLDNTQIPGWEKTDLSIPRRGRSALEIATVIRRAYEHRCLPQTAGAPPAARQELARLTEAQMLEEALRGSRMEIRSRLIETLNRNQTRAEVLKANQLNANITVNTLVDTVLDVVPRSRPAGQRQSPLCFIHRTIEALDDRGTLDVALVNDIEALTALLLPLSIEDKYGNALDRTAEAALHIQRFQGTDKMIGASVVGRLLGLQVWPDTNRRPMIRNAVFPGREKEGLPIDGLHCRDLVDAVRLVLARTLPTCRSDAAEHVKAALRLLAGRKAFVCLWLMQEPAEDQVRQLHETFPHLILLHGDGDSDTDVNATVLLQLTEIQNFILTHRGPQT
jgi:hypothetical protein